ncbi:Acetate kinase 2 [Gossypium arboreum]|uniref:Acetate kinase 2 n=1 Tax=Gossypium arboreum TaxID=29729 RepID=A0A0B0PDZ4_GOSAR|nr:Acetate kinase 2 [Gossypium arboreum]
MWHFVCEISRVSDIIPSGSTSMSKTRCYQASSDWRLTEIASHYQAVILGIDDLKHFEYMASLIVDVLVA